MAKRRNLHVYGTSASGGMMYHPYYYSADIQPAMKHTPEFATEIGQLMGGRWVHNPFHVAKRAIGGAGLATAISQGNLMTRAFRQKPLVMLQKAEHKRVAKAPPLQRGIVEFPTTIGRRTKSYKNKILHTSKAMPYKRQRKFTRKPRKFKKRRGGRRRRLSNLWAPTHVAKLRLVHTVTYTGTGGAIGTNYIKANSLNDPTGGASAQLPLGVDQWAALYQKYKVIGSKITLRAHPVTITGSAMIGIHLSNSTTPPATDHDHYRELPHTNMRMLSPDIDLCKLSMGFSPKKYPFHIKNVKDADDLEGTFSTTPGDPTDLAYWHVFVQDSNKTDNVTFEIQMVIDYIVLLYDPVRPSRSAL